MLDQNPFSKGWEPLGHSLHRFSVPGGWIYRYEHSGQYSLVYVPDRYKDEEIA